MPLTEVSGDLELDGSLWILFVADTILIAVGGYIVNDIMDQKTDLYNKPDRIYIGQNKISVKAGWSYYFFCGFIGLLCCLLHCIQNWKNTFIGYLSDFCRITFYVFLTFQKNAAYR